MGIVLVCATCTSCALHPTTWVQPPLPVTFEQKDEEPAHWPGADWYHGFASAELDGLIAQAASHNVDLGMARARIAQADARARQAHAPILPIIDADGAGNYFAGHSINGTAHETDWSALLSASYEIDFWGKNHAASAAARLLAVAARADRDTVAITTLAGVADTYFQILSLRERLHIARSNRDAAQLLLQIVAARFGAGMSNPVDVSAQRAALADTELMIPELEQSESETMAALALLLGRAPENFRIEGGALESLQEPTLNAGLPSELLRRRPDILRAESNLKSASADLLAARAALYPSLSLTAAGGVQNPALNAAVIQLSGVGSTLNLGASLTQPLIDGGRLRAVRAEAQAKEDELTISYRAAILAALVDVENALSAVHHLNAARRVELETVTLSERSFAGAQLRYQAGSGDFTMVLEAQKAVYATRDSFSRYQLAKLQAWVSLCKALGGGWQSSGVSGS